MLFRKHRVGNFHKNAVTAGQSVYDSTRQESLNLDFGIYENRDGIYITTDAHHEWRKNDTDASTVAIQDKLHKLLQCNSYHKADDMVSQSHNYRSILKRKM